MAEFLLAVLAPLAELRRAVYLTLTLAFLTLLLPAVCVMHLSLKAVKDPAAIPEAVSTQTKGAKHNKKGKQKSSKLRRPPSLPMHGSEVAANAGVHSDPASMQECRSPVKLVLHKELPMPPDGEAKPLQPAKGVDSPGADARRTAAAAKTRTVAQGSAPPLQNATGQTDNGAATGYGVTVREQAGAGPGDGHEAGSWGTAAATPLTADAETGLAEGPTAGNETLESEDGAMSEADNHISGGAWSVVGSAASMDLEDTPESNPGGGSYSRAILLAHRVIYLRILQGPPGLEQIERAPAPQLGSGQPYSCTDATTACMILA